MITRRCSRAQTAAPADVCVMPHRFKMNAQKYRKKPVEIEAIQISEKTEYIIKKWSDGKVYPSPVLEPTEYNPKGVCWQIDTLEGIMTAIPGDWIIKGIKGEFYPCKNEIFIQSYEQA